MTTTQHKGGANSCPACKKNSKATKCTYCNHALTGKVDEHGWTTCENCSKHIWLGVGNAND